MPFRAHSVRYGKTVAPQSSQATVAKEGATYTRWLEATRPSTGSQVGFVYCAGEPGHFPEHHEELAKYFTEVTHMIGDLGQLWWQ